MNKTVKLNVNYAMLNAMQSAVFAGLSAYGTVFLLSRGIADSEIGLIFSVANILAAFIQPWIANKVEQANKWTLREFNLLFAVPSIVVLAGVLIKSMPLLMVAILFMMAFAFLQILTPLLSSIGVLFINHGYKLNYGICRAAGSLSFGIVSALLGWAVAQMGTNVIIIAMIMCYVFYILILFRIPIAQVTAPGEVQVSEGIGEVIDDFTETDAEPGLSFHKKYPQFMFVLAGSMLFFVFHNLINTYMIQIIENIGGGEAEMGLAIGIAAVFEIPVMIFYSKIQRFLSNRHILFISGLFFLLKAVLMFWATSFFGMYVAMAMQLFSFGPYIIASIYYTNDVMAATDKVKGQAMVTTAHTVGGVIGNLTGGWLIQWVSVEATLLYSVILCALGVLAYILGLRENKA